MIVGQWPYIGDISTIRRSWGCIGFYSQQIWGTWNNQRWLECHRFFLIFFVNMIKIVKAIVVRYNRQTWGTNILGCCGKTTDSTCSPDLVATVPLPWACREKRAAHLEWSRTRWPDHVGFFGWCQRYRLLVEIGRGFVCWTWRSCEFSSDRIAIGSSAPHRIASEKDTTGDLGSLWIFQHFSCGLVYWCHVP